MAKQLILVLEQELELHSRLVSASRAMNNAVKEKTMGEIQSATRNHNECISRIEELEEQRLTLCDALCAATVKKGRHASLLLAIDHLDKEDGSTVFALRARLKNMLNELSGINSSNKVLITESIYANQKTFEMVITHHEKRHSGYKKQGTREQAKQSTSLINRII
jgi:flagellar biosynthesis/type III secretory pathway chaperone